MVVDVKIERTLLQSAVEVEAEGAGGAVVGEAKARGFAFGAVEWGGTAVVGGRWVAEEDEGVVGVEGVERLKGELEARDVDEEGAGGAPVVVA